MTTLLDHVPTRPATSTTPAQRLRATMAAVRLSFTWLGTRKTLTPEQRALAAEPFDAEGQFLSAGKKLLDTRITATILPTLKIYIFHRFKSRQRTDVDRFSNFSYPNC